MGPASIQFRAPSSRSAFLHLFFLSQLFCFNHSFLLLKPFRRSGLQLLASRHTPPTADRQAIGDPTVQTNLRRWPITDRLQTILAASNYPRSFDEGRIRRRGIRRRRGRGREKNLIYWWTNRELERIYYSTQNVVHLNTRARLGRGRVTVAVAVAEWRQTGAYDRLETGLQGICSWSVFGNC